MRQSFYVRGEVIREHRRRKEWTQSDLVEKSRQLSDPRHEVRGDTISRMENRPEDKFYLEKISGVAQLLDLAIDDLVRADTGFWCIPPNRVDFRPQFPPEEDGWEDEALMITPLSLHIGTGDSPVRDLCLASIELRTSLHSTCAWVGTWYVEIHPGAKGWFGQTRNFEPVPVYEGRPFSGQLMFVSPDSHAPTWRSFVEDVLKTTDRTLRLDLTFDLGRAQYNCSHSIAMRQIKEYIHLASQRNDYSYPTFFQPEVID